MKKRALIIGIPLLLFAGLILFSVVRRVIGGRDNTATVEGVAVAVARPERRRIEEILRYPGTLKPRQTVMIAPKVGGRVEKLYVKKGDRVRPDQLLAEIDNESMRIQAEQAYAAWQAAEAQVRAAQRGPRKEELENARASFEQAEQDLELAKTNFERSKRLYEAGTIAKAKFEEAESTYRSAQTQLENARRSLKMMEEGASDEELDAVRSNAEALKAQYDLASLQLDNTEVRSSVYGRVVSVQVDEGNLVSTGTPLVALVSENPINAVIDVPEKHYSRFTERDRTIDVRVFPVAFPDSDGFQGVVNSVATVIDTQSRTFEVEASIDNPGGDLKPGMYVNTEIVIDRHDDAIVIPENAVVRRDDRSVVYAVSEGDSYHAKEKSIETGIRSDGFVEIVSGISAGDEIVIEGNAFLEDDQLLRIIENE